MCSGIDSPHYCQRARKSKKDRPQGVSKRAIPLFIETRREHRLFIPIFSPTHFDKFMSVVVRKEFDTEDERPRRRMLRSALTSAFVNTC